jgi:hypothetical protein
MSGLNESLNDANKKADALKARLEALKEKYEDMTLKDAPLLFDPKEEQTAEQLEGHIKSMGVLIKNMKPDLQGLSDIFKNTVNDLTKGNKELVRQRQSLAKSSNLADQLLQIKRGEVSATSKSIGKIKEKLELERQNLLYLARQRNIDKEKRAELVSQINQLQGVIQSAENLDKIYKETNKSLGFAPRLLAGMDKALQKLGVPSLGIDNALKETHKLAQEAKNAGKSFSASKEFTKQLAKNLKEATSTANFMQAAVGFIFKSFLEVDKSVGSFAKSMNMSYSEASKVKQQMTGIAQASGDSLLNSQRLMETQVAVGEALGSNAMLNQADLETMTKMTAAAGLTHEELMGIEKMSLVNGKTLESNTQEILGSAQAYAAQNKLTVNAKQILKDVNKASASLKLSLGANPKLLAEAAVKARQFGLSLEQADKMAESLLDFESSIESELEAELLTGKNINFEKARELALNNDIAGAAELIAQQIGDSASFSKMNRIQQEALAKAAGMTRDELAQSLMDREALIKLGAKEGQDAQDRYNEMRAAGMSEAAIAEKLGDDELARMYEQQSVQEKFNDTMTELKEMLSEELLPAFQTAGEFLKENMGLVKGMAKFMLILKAAQIGYNVGSAIALTLARKKKVESKKDAVGEIWGGAFESLGGIPVVGVVLAIAAALGATALMMGAFADDMVSKPGYGKRTLFGPEGAIQLNDKDTVIAATNPFGFGDDVISEPNQSTEMMEKGEVSIKPESPTKTDQKIEIKNKDEIKSPSMELSATNSILDKILTAIERGSTIEMDSQKIGETINLGARSISG